MSTVLRCFLNLALLLLISGGLAGAEIFKCTRSDGTVVFTDNPSAKLGDCQREGGKTLPTLEMSEPPLQPTEPQPVVGASPKPPAKPGEPSPFAAFNSEATALVEKFQAARRQLNFSSFAKDQLAARRELADIRQQKTSLLTGINSADLTSAEKQQLTERLATISE